MNPRKECTDDEIIRKLRSGNENDRNEAYKCLIRNCKSKAYKAFRRVGVREEELEEAFVDCLMLLEIAVCREGFQLWSTRFNRPVELCTFLYGFCINWGRQIIRGRPKPQPPKRPDNPESDPDIQEMIDRVYDDLDNLYKPPGPDPAIYSDNDDPDMEKLSKEMYDRLDKVPLDCRRVLFYHIWLRLSHDQIAQIMGYRNAQYSRIKKNRCMDKLINDF